GLVALGEEFAPAEERLGLELALLAEGGDGQAALVPGGQGLPPERFFGWVAGLAHGGPPSGSPHSRCPFSDFTDAVPWPLTMFARLAQRHTAPGPHRDATAGSPGPEPRKPGGHLPGGVRASRAATCAHRFCQATCSASGSLASA